MVTCSTAYHPSYHQSTRSIFASTSETTNNEKTLSQNPSSPSQYIYIPTKTRDYIIHRGEKGLGLYANQDIMEGEEVFTNSLKYTVTDVDDGDYIVFNTKKVLERTKLAAKQAYNVVPFYVPVESDLIFTHGIPVLSDDPEDEESSGIISYHVKVPSMLMNHSCDPNIIHEDGIDGHDRPLATRDIVKGEELTTDYSLIYYDEGPIQHRCLCGSANCSGMVKGFKDLDTDAQDRLMPVASLAVRALFMADLKLEKPVKYELPLVAEREVQAPIFSLSEGFRLVCPPPSHTNSDIGVAVSDNDNSHGLYALRNFQEGEIVYTFWVDDWPLDGKVPVDMVFSMAIGEGDPVEGTSFWINPAERGYRNANGRMTFSGFNMLVEHSCDPNIVYKHTKVTDHQRWQHAYAARDIVEGENLLIDMNNLFWDRTELKIATCSCKAKQCAGTIKGFKYLSSIRQKKRWVDSDNGRHLSPFIRLQCKKRDTYYHEVVCDYDSDTYGMKLEQREDELVEIDGRTQFAASTRGRESMPRDDGTQFTGSTWERESMTIGGGSSRNLSARGDLREEELVPVSNSQSRRGRLTGTGTVPSKLFRRSSANSNLTTTSTEFGTPSLRDSFSTMRSTSSRSIEPSSQSSRRSSVDMMDARDR